MSIVHVYEVKIGTDLGTISSRIANVTDSINQELGNLVGPGHSIKIYGSINLRFSSSRALDCQERGLLLDCVRKATTDSSYKPLSGIIYRGVLSNEGQPIDIIA